MENNASEVTLKDFANSFGTTVDDLSEDCRQLAKKYNFRYRELDKDERDQVILEVLKRIDSKELSIVGAHRKGRWDDGWSENLKNFIEKKYDLKELIPKYIHPNQPVRLNGDYVMPEDPEFEYNFFQVYRLWLFRKYLKDFDSIVEFGSGTGHNLVVLSQLYPEKKLYGSDWVPPSVELLNKIKEVYGYNITAKLFDLFNPDESFQIPENSAVITMGTMEQLGVNYEKFLDFILKKSPRICLQSEPICELYDDKNLLDYVFIKYHQRRGYLSGYLTRLKQLEAEGKIEIIKIQRVFLGNLVQEGYSIIVWKPKI